MRCYQLGIQYFLHTIKCNRSFHFNICVILFNSLLLFCIFQDETHSEKAKQSIREKCTQYLERDEKLKDYIKEKNSGGEKKKKPIKDGDSKE